MTTGKVFITGGSGFVGGALIAAWCDEAPVVAMARSDASADVVAGRGAQPARCSLEDVRPADLAGCDTVVHAAARVEEWGRRSDFWIPNVEGTQRLLDASIAAGVRHFIHISTDSVLFAGEHLREVDETVPYPVRSTFPYAASKAEAERRVLAANQERMRTVAVRPVLIWGPGDRTILPVLAELVRENKFVWIDHGRTRVSTTHIDNLVHGVRLAAERGRGGEVYYISDDETLSQREFVTRYLATVGLEPTSRSLPGPLVRTAANLVEPAWQAVRPKSPPPFTRLAANLLSRDSTVRIDKARRELGFEPVVTVDEGLERLTA